MFDDEGTGYKLGSVSSVSSGSTISCTDISKSQAKKERRGFKKVNFVGHISVEAVKIKILGAFRKRTPSTPDEGNVAIQAPSADVTIRHSPTLERESITLANLPAEVLLNIAAFLPISSSAALALCSREIQCKMGWVYFQEINKIKWKPYTDSCNSADDTALPCPPEEEDRQTFLELLDRGSLDFIYCYYCKRLHKPDLTDSEKDIRPFVDFHKRRACSQVHSYYKPHNYLHQDFTFSRAKNVMKHHRAGLDCTPLLKVLSRTVTNFRDTHTQQNSVTCRISLHDSGRLLVRAQHWFLVRTDPNPLFPAEYSIDLCPHLSTWSGTSLPGLLDKLIVCTSSHSSAISCSTCSTLYQCSQCATEFQIDSKYFGERGWGMCFSVWHDFGDCRTPFEEKFENLHLSVPSRGRKSPEFKLGSIKSAFEEFRFDGNLSVRRMMALGGGVKEGVKSGEFMPFGKSDDGFDADFTLGV
jgi:hypothetical protein